MCIEKISNDDLNRPTPDEFNAQSRQQFVVVLDNIRSMQNIGSVFRTTDAFAGAGIYLCGITAQPPHRDIHKAALGATDTVPWHYHPTTTEALATLRRQGYTIVGIEQTTPRNFLHQHTPSPDQKYAFVFGNEVFGLSDEVLPLCDFCLEIPQLGAKHSLNISVSVGVVLWHYALGCGIFS